MRLDEDDRRTIRTLVQVAVAAAVALPGIIQASGVDETLPWVVGLLAVAGVVTRLMTAWDPYLPAWLRAHPPVPELHLPELAEERTRISLGLIQQADPRALRADGDRVVVAGNVYRITGWDGLALTAERVDEDDPEEAP